MKKIALITGASSGLGKEFVRQLDKDPSVEEFFVVARRKDRLERLQQYTSKPVVVLPFDLAVVENIERLETILKEHNITITVLVVAAGLGRFGKTTEMDLRTVNQMIDVNVKGAVDVTLIAIPFMARGSRIIEIASIAGFSPMPYINVYGATKAFLINFSKALAYELKEDGISVTALCPYWVKDTEFIDGAKRTSQERWTKYTLATYKKGVVKRALIDSKKGRWMSTPGIVVRMERIVSKVLPDALIVRIMDAASKRK